MQGRILQTFIRSFIPFLSAVIILKRIEFIWYWIVLCPIEMAVCYLKQYNYSLCNEEITSWFFIHKWILTIKYALCFLLLLEERKSTCTNATFKSKPSCCWFLKFHFLPFKKPEMVPHRLHQQGVKGAGWVIFTLQDWWYILCFSFIAEILADFFKKYITFWSPFKDFSSFLTCIFLGGLKSPW